MCYRLIILKIQKKALLLLWLHQNVSWKGTFNPQGTNWVHETQANFESGAICRGPMAAPPTKGGKKVWGTICLSLR